ncbi:Microneme protein etmic-2/7h, related [Eimeria praecox]|uniref:Microneme protein etmic-2/7h, related n=1 Tax=Eimeria praecox TaxID=51316 RepID=U6H398_9EIME|nr:Microneme protein etmic-2/7h, related [Eimeria praecox]
MYALVFKPVVGCWYSMKQGLMRIMSSPARLQPWNEPSARESALTAGSLNKDHTGVGGLVEANCGRLTVRGGLKEGESVKITANGWGKGSADFVVELVTDNSRGMALMRESPGEGGPGLAGGGSQDGAAGGANGVEGPTAEQPSIPIVGVRISGSEDGDGEPRKAAVLLYKEGETAPKELLLDSPAGPTSAFMVIFKQKTSTEMTVRLLTWISGGSGVKGSWHEASVDAGVGFNNRDLMVSLSDCNPHSLRVYGSASADLVTASGDMCQANDIQLVSLTSSPPTESPPVPDASSDGSTEASTDVPSDASTSA